MRAMVHRADQQQAGSSQAETPPHKRGGGCKSAYRTTCQRPKIGARSARSTYPSHEHQRRYWNGGAVQYAAGVT